MSLALILTMGSVSIGGAFIERLLNKIGETDKASLVGVVSTSMLITTAVGCVVTGLNEVRKLSGK